MLEADFSIIFAEINAIINRARNNSVFLHEVGAREQGKAISRIFDDKQSPIGLDWAPWSERRAHERAEKGNADQGLLWDTGLLAHSIEYEAGTMSVEIGSPLDYAKDLQFGTDIMPAREFLGWNPEDYPVYENLYVRYLETGTV